MNIGRIGGPGTPVPVNPPHARALFSAQPGAAFGDAKEGVPGFLLLDGYAGRLQIEQARQAFDSRPLDRQEFLASIRRTASSALQSSLDLVSRHLGRLKSASAALQADATYLQGKASTSEGGDLTLRVDATDGAGQPPAEVTVLSLATSREAASDPRPDAGAALGVRGSFFLDGPYGVEIPVLSTDNLYTLADRITWGEDANRNGRLDGAEDRNFSLTLDGLEDANGNGRLDTGEDANGNGSLDAGEDLNHNGRLDANEDLDFDGRITGGTAVHGLEARVLGNRLVLKRAEPGPRDISVQDPDGILEATLGLVETDRRDERIFSHALAEPSGARLTVNGELQSLDSNVATGLLEGVSLEARRTGGPLTVSVSRDDSAAVSAVRRFVSEFNGLVGELNSLLIDGGTGAHQRDLQRLRRGLERSSQDPLSTGTAAGLSPASTEDIRFSEPQVRQALDRLRQGLWGIFDSVHGVPSAANHLSQLGIRTLQDDTLALDETALSEALGRDPAGVRKLLSDGIAKGVDAALEAAAGALPRARQALGGVSLTPLVKGVQRFRQIQQLGEASRLIAVA